MTAQQTKSQQLREIEYQTRMIENLKKWVRNLIVISSIGVAMAYWALKLQNGMIYNVVGVISITIIVVSVILCAVIGLAIKNGRANIEKIKKVIH
ncbi:MAG: hypothetical protein PUC17_03800 [Anaerostipes sp.]|nr:hypothetical protein [Anaerostipes sp.]